MGVGVLERSVVGGWKLERTAVVGGWRWEMHVCHSGHHPSISTAGLNFPLTFDLRRRSAMCQRERERVGG